MAEEAGLDLVEINPIADPHVCEICNAGRVFYRKGKKQKESGKRLRAVRLREIPLTVKISNHDLETKIRKAKELFERGNKVRFKLIFKGREIQHKEIGEELLKRVEDMLSDCAVIESSIRSEGRKMIMFMRSK